MTIVVHNNDLPSDFSYSSSVAIDVESTGLHLHRDRLCVVQMYCGDGGSVHLVQIDKDQKDAPVLCKILADKDCLKIFHFGRFDIAMLYKQFNILANPVYCTKIASKIARTYSQSHGLKALCRELLGVDLNKVSQCSYWGRELLTKDQQRYAASDVLYLHRLKLELDRMMQREGRDGFCSACCEFLPSLVSLDIAGWEGERVFSHD